jgi:hypothetical protein
MHKISRVFRKHFSGLQATSSSVRRWNNEEFIPKNVRPPGVLKISGVLNASETEGALLCPPYCRKVPPSHEQNPIKIRTGDLVLTLFHSDVRSRQMNEMDLNVIFLRSRSQTFHKLCVYKTCVSCAAQFGVCEGKPCCREMRREYRSSSPTKRARSSPSPQNAPLAKMPKVPPASSDEGSPKTSSSAAPRDHTLQVHGHSTAIRSGPPGSHFESNFQFCKV